MDLRYFIQHLNYRKIICNDNVVVHFLEEVKSKRKKEKKREKREKVKDWRSKWERQENEQGNKQNPLPWSPSKTTLDTYFHHAAALA